MISEAEEIEGEVLKEEVFLTRVVESEKSISVLGRSYRQ